MIREAELEAAIEKIREEVWKPELGALHAREPIRGRDVIRPAVC
jgi:glutamate formiminotransferase